MPTPPTRFSPLKIRLNRSARRLLWPRPAMYSPIGLLRKRGNVLKKAEEIFFCGYPRSGNTFARAAFLLANPGAKLQSHQHIPPFVLHQVRERVPGLILIRKPLDAAISWAIHENQSLEEAVAYWNDYYETLMRVRAGLYVARFEDVTSDFGGVIEGFNAMWGTGYARFEHTEGNMAQCFEFSDNRVEGRDERAREMRVCRPSAKRRVVKESVLDEMELSGFLRHELERANELYERFVNYRTPAVAPESEAAAVYPVREYAGMATR